jgi:alkylated DNA repair dioxygenase AlkB
MVVAPPLVWQASLFGADQPRVDVSFDRLVRHQLDANAWVDQVEGWLTGSNELFEWLLHNVDWGEHDRLMYGRMVAQPRLTAPHWRPHEDDTPVPLRAMATALTERYGRTFDSVGANLYRDGRDSVAWHGDRIARTVDQPLVATISLGDRRRFLLRPKGGGPSVKFEPGPGDLLVMGGMCQRTWQHTVPKVARAGPRMSVTVRTTEGGEL